MTRNIGLDVQTPENTCTDPNCPFDGALSVRGQVIEGRVASIKGERTVIVERQRLWKLPKYERYEKRTGRYAAHHPPCITLKVGDHVKIAECRPISKTKSFVIVEARAGKLEVHGEDVGAPVIEAEATDEDAEDEAEDAPGAAAEDEVDVGSTEAQDDESSAEEDASAEASSQADDEAEPGTEGGSEADAQADADDDPEEVEA